MEYHLGLASSLQQQACCVSLCTLSVRFSIVLATDQSNTCLKAYTNFIVPFRLEG